jgi:hypothetical protein
MHLNTAEARSVYVHKVRLKTLDCLDARTRAVRYARRLVETYRRQRGGKFSPAERMAAERAAMLGALAMDAKARLLAGDKSVGALDVVRLDGAFARAERALLAVMRKPAKAEPADGVPTLGELLERAK